MYIYSPPGLSLQSGSALQYPPVAYTDRSGSRESSPNKCWQVLHRTAVNLISAQILMAALEKDYEEVGAESLEGAGEDEECY